MDKFNSGEIVYGDSGQQYRFIGYVGSNYCVARYEEGDPDCGPCEWWGEPIVVGRLYKEPPKPVLDKELQDLQERVENKRREIKMWSNNYDLVEKDLKNKIENIISKSDNLKHLEDFLEGKITHFVFTSYDIGIKTLEEALEFTEYGKKRIKFLSLYGDLGGKVNWEIREYLGSEYSQTVIPCTSYEMALDELNKFLSACFATFDPDIEHDCDTAIRTADKYGVIDSRYPLTSHKAFWN